MSDPQNTTQAVAVRPPRELRVVEDNGPLAFLFDTAKFEHLQRISKLMAGASLIPDHLKGRTPEETLGNCFLVVNQAVRWGFDPFSVAQGTYVVKGKLGFEGKIIAAVVNARAGLDGPLDYQFNDLSGDNLEVTVIGKIGGVEKTVAVSVGQAKTENQMWKKDPYQKLVYTGAIKWARRWCPETVLGVVTEDDLERWETTTRVPTASFIDAPPAQVIPPPQIANASEALKTAVIEPEREPTPQKRGKPHPATVKDPEPPKQDDSNAELNPVQENAASAPSQPEQASSSTSAANPSAPSVPPDYLPDFDHPHDSLRKCLIRDGIPEAKFIAYLKHLRFLKPADTTLDQLLATKALALFNSWALHKQQSMDPNFIQGK